MRAIALVMACAVGFAPAGCATVENGTVPEGDLDATGTEDGTGGSAPHPAVVAGIAAIVLIALVAAGSASSDPFLDYSDVCGTPNC